MFHGLNNITRTLQERKTTLQLARILFCEFITEFSGHKMLCENIVRNVNNIHFDRAVSQLRSNFEHELLFLEKK